jgi:hypothetical protein
MEKLQEWQSKCETLLEERANSTNWGGPGGGGGGRGQRTRTLTGASVSFAGARELKGKGRGKSEDYTMMPQDEFEKASILKKASEHRGSEVRDDRAPPEGRDREAGKDMGGERAEEEKVGLKDILIRSLETSADVLGKILSEGGEGKDDDDDDDDDDFFGTTFAYEQAEGGGETDQRETGASSPGRTKGKASKSPKSLKTPKSPISQANTKGGRRKLGVGMQPRRKQMGSLAKARTTSKNVPILSLDLTNL